jgi:hypothetical protein
VKLLTLKQAEASSDVDVRLVTVRASRFRVFGSSERIPDGLLAVADLRDGAIPEDFEEQFQVLDRHPMKPVCLVKKRS